MGLGKRSILSISIILVMIPFALGFGVSQWSNDMRYGRIELLIFKNDNLIYYDRDDPATYNFALFLATFLAEEESQWEGRDIVAIDGSILDEYFYAVSVKSGTINPHIIISDTNTTITRSTYNLPGNVIHLNTSVSVIDDGTNLIVAVSASYTYTVASTLAVVGLEAYFDVGFYKEVLFFADDVNPDIAVNANDTVTVVYRIILP